MGDAHVLITFHTLTSSCIAIVHGLIAVRPFTCIAFTTLSTPSSTLFVPNNTQRSERMEKKFLGTCGDESVIIMIGVIFARGICW